MIAENTKNNINLINNLKQSIPFGINILKYAANKENYGLEEE